MENTKMKFTVNGLDCANCASKIEMNIKKIPSVKEANLDFVSKKLIIKAPESEHERIKNEVKRIVSQIEPEAELLDEEKKEEEQETKNKDLFIIVFSSILFLGAFIFKFPLKVKITMYFISYVLCGGEILLKALKNIAHGQVFDENFLMSVATIGAFAMQQFSEAAAVMIFYRIGEYLEDLAVDHSRRSITELMNIRPDYANLKVDAAIKKVSPESVDIGDYIVIKPGEKVPLDGVIIKGRSMMDTSALTGESVPRSVQENNEVLSGFINENGLLTVKVTKIYSESTVSKILELTQNASGRKSQTEKFITKFARIYTPIVVFTAVLLALVPTLIMGASYFHMWMYRALIFLVVSCPCALVISIPLSYFAGIGCASKNGILVKGSNFIEILKNVDKIVFDKTGTLTKGVFKVTDIKCEDGFKKEQLVEFAAYAEAFSNHPIARSILNEYKGNIDKDNIKKYDEINGMGTKICLNDGTCVIAGNDKMMENSDIKYENIKSPATIIHIAVNNKYAGYMIIADELKDDSLKAISELKKTGIKNIAMLTGDNKNIAEIAAEKLGINEFYAELLPNEKVNMIEKMEKESAKGKIAFVGDGINDAPVLSRADVGIAMGGLGSDAAIEAADVVIMTDEPSKIVNALKIARKTSSIAWQNIIFAITVKIIVLVLGAAGYAAMWEAIFADVGVTVIAVLNSMRCFKIKNS